MSKERACVECGSAMLPRTTDVTCSTKCHRNRKYRQQRAGYAARNAGRPRRPAEKSCRHCGEQFTTLSNNGRYCTNCRRPGGIGLSLNLRTPEYRRANTLKTFYRMTLDDYEVLLVGQNGQCAVQGCTISEDLHVDHDHACCPGRRSCGKCVRGLLCAPHNQMLGFAQDDPIQLESAAQYVRDWLARQVA